MNTTADSLKSLGYLFYVVNPQESSFRDIDSVPDYITKVIPYFVTLVLIEQIVAYFKGFPLIRVNDSIGSMSQGMFMEITKTAFNALILIYYTYIYENWRIFTLRWDSTSTWILALFAVDLGYYWIHRWSHEINVLWAAHQVHHSSQEYNLTTALRQAVLHSPIQYAVYLPLALVIPPPAFLVHNQFNILYQFWIHTKVIKTVGPLEYILNTPSHHRVHHGRNEYCIDKNYAGVLIIWDRMFGTFVAEKEDISYGLTHNVNSFDPFYIQMHHYFNIFNNFKRVKGLKNKLCSLFAGPGWSAPEDSNDAGDSKQSNDYASDDNSIYDPDCSAFLKVYACIHFAIIIIIHTNFMHALNILPPLRVIICTTFIFISLTSFGLILDGKKGAKIFEMLRCVGFLLIQTKFISGLFDDKNNSLMQFIEYTFLISVALLFLDSIKNHFIPLNASNDSKHKAQ